MTRTKLDDLTTDENGQATYTYTGTGAGEIGFVAVYDETDSNIVTIDDYTPVATSVGLALSNNNVTYGTSVTLTATVKDKHDQNISSGTVTFKDGNTSIGTGSISNGVATLTKSNFDWGSHSLTAEINNIVSTAVTLNVNKLNTATTIVPPTLYYKDEFDVSGTLKDANGMGLVGETVTLLWNDGSDHTATATTTTDGAYTFHRDAPTSITEYSFKVTYAGTDNYNASETGTSTVTVNKELTVTAIISPTNGSKVSGDVVLTGTLLDDEGSPLDTSSSMVISKTNPSYSEIGVATVGSDGSFSYTVPASSLNNVVTYLQAEYFSTTNYGHSFATIVVYRAIYNGVALSKTAGKQILSYADYSAQSNTEYCTVTAQLKNGNNNANISGVSVVFNKVDSQGTIISQLGTGTTDSNGQASYTYTSVGAGDVRIRADVGSLVTERYDIKDAIKYYSGTLTTTTVISVPNLPTDFEMSWKAIRQSGKTAYMKFGLSEAHVIYGGILSTYEDRDNIGIYRYVQGEGNKEGGLISNYNLPANVEKTITMRHENNTASISVDGYSKSFTNTALTDRDYVRADINGGSIKEILIMPL